jgi:hypothetical protein
VSGTAKPRCRSSVSVMVCSAPIPSQYLLLARRGQKRDSTAQRFSRTGTRALDFITLVSQLGKQFLVNPPSDLVAHTPENASLRGNPAERRNCQSSSAGTCRFVGRSDTVLSGVVADRDDISEIPALIRWSTWRFPVPLLQSANGGDRIRTHLRPDWENVGGENSGRT